MCCFLKGGTDGDGFRNRLAGSWGFCHLLFIIYFPDEPANVPPTKCIAERQTVPIRLADTLLHNTSGDC